MARDEPPKHSGIIGSLVAPAPMIVAAVTVGGALLLSPWVLVVGVPAWGLAVVATIFGELKDRAQQSIERDRQIAALPPELQEMARRIERTVERIHETIDTSDDDVRYMMVNLQTEVRELADSSRDLLGSARHMHEYLQEHPPEALQEQRRRLRERLKQADDQGTRDQLQETLQELDEQIETRERIRALQQRTEAALSNIDASLGTVHAHVIQLSSNNMSGVPAERGPMQELDEVRGSVAALQEVIGSEMSQTV
ncbi:MAG: hypothetical protein R6V19_07945 [Armatimonadota bacterium]